MSNTNLEYLDVCVVPMCLSHGLRGSSFSSCGFSGHCLFAAGKVSSAGVGGVGESSSLKSQSLGVLQFFSQST